MHALGNSAADMRGTDAFDYRRLGSANRTLS